MIADDPGQWRKAEDEPADDPHAAERARIMAEYQAANPGVVLFWIKATALRLQSAPAAADAQADTDADVDRIVRLFGFPRPQPQGPTE